MANQLTLETLWGVRRGESTPELMEAWDEYSIDQYREGWADACQKAIASWGSDLDQYRWIDIVVDMDEIEATFQAATVYGRLGVSFDEVRRAIG